MGQGGPGGQYQARLICCDVFSFATSALMSHMGHSRRFQMWRTRPPGPRKPASRVYDYPPCSYAAIFTYSKSPGLLSMPTRGGAIQLANLPGSVTGFIRLWMKSPSFFDGSHLSRSRFQVASLTVVPSGVAWNSLNSPM